MKYVIKALAPVDGEMKQCDTIQIEGKFWLVPEWTYNRSEGWKTPVRIVALEGLAHHPTTLHGASILVEDSIPKSVLDGRAPPELGGMYTVREARGIRVPLQTDD